MLDTQFVPATAPDSKRLMVVLHGLGDSIQGYTWLPSALALPAMNYLLVNAPDQYFGGYSWYDFTGQQEAGIRRSRRMLFELLDLQRREGFPTDQTTLFGFSQGCLMIWEMGFHYPHRFAGLVGVSGYAHEPEKAVSDFSPVAKEQRFLITHGRQDPMVPFNEVKIQVGVIQNLGLNVEWREFDKPHTIAGEEELDVIRDFVVKGYEAST